MKKFICFILLLLFSAAGHASVKACVSVPRVYSIKEIQAFAKSKVGSRVRIKGAFMGWKSKEPPPITRSDWIIKDNTGEIYVTGSFPGKLSPLDKRHIGKKVIVMGIVSEAKKDKNTKVIYLKGISAYVL